MNAGHVEPGEVINLNTLKEDMPVDSTYALVKTSDMEVIRMAIPKGREVPEHSVQGEMSAQCLEGKIEFMVGKESHTLEEGDWLYLNRNQPHSLRALTDAVLLVTILFTSDS